MEAQTDSRQIIFWQNSKTVDSCFSLSIPNSIDTIKKLKEFLFLEKNINKSYFDRVIFYNYKGLELDDSDISYLTNKQVVYLSIDGSKFSTLNYVNEYQFVKTIKKGGYAEVYLAKNALSHELVSIKKTDLHNFSTEELYNISREAVYLSSLIHKNIIKMYNSYTYEDCLFNVMAYAEGGELTQLLIEPEPIPEERIKDLFHQIHNAVQFIHSKNVIHRDLKPNNLLFLDKEKTQLVLIDFGISGICNGMSREVIKAGTLKYVPPEMISGEVYQSTPKIDIWALGIILYLLNFKTFPFEGNDNDVMEKIVNEPVQFPHEKKIKKSLVDLIEGLLMKNPNKRIDINDPLFDIWYNDDSNEYQIFLKENEHLNGGMGKVMRSKTVKNAEKSKLFNKSVNTKTSSANSLSKIRNASIINSGKKTGKLSFTSKPLHLLSDSPKKKK